MSNSMHGERQARSKATDLPRSVANKCPSSFILIYHSHQFFCPAFFLRRAVCEFPTQADQHAKLLGAYSSQERAASARSRRSLCIESDIFSPRQDVLSFSSLLLNIENEQLRNPKEIPAVFLLESQISPRGHAAPGVFHCHQSVWPLVSVNQRISGELH